MYACKTRHSAPSGSGKRGPRRRTNSLDLFEFVLVECELAVTLQCGVKLAIR